MCATAAKKTPQPPLADRFASVLATARNWALCLVAVSVLFKLVWVIWCATEGAFRLHGWEWAALPVFGTYQHVIFGVACFVLYTLLLVPSLVWRPLRVGGLIVMSGLQALGVLYFMTALRMALLLGTPPTFGLLEAGAEGGVVGASLIEPENLPYTIVGAIVAAATVFGAFLAERRWPGWPRLPRLAISLAVLALWVTGGAVAIGAVHSDVHHADTEPVSFFFSELFEERAEREAPVVEHNPEAFQTGLIFGDEDMDRTAHLARNLDAWRQTRRNVVLIVLESVGARNASYYGPVTVHGETRDTTPNLASLREHMLLMENHYAVHSTSMENLFSIACSLYPYPLRPVITDVNPTIPCGSMPEMLVDAGYHAGLFHSGHFSFWRKDLFFDNRGFEVMYDADSMPGRQGAYEYNWGIDERVTTRAIADYIHTNRDRSFFVQYIPVFPHAPYQVPSEDLEVFPGDERIDDYHNSLRYVDGAIGTIIDALREDDLLDDTLLIVLSDHGEAFDEHPGNRCHSAFIYDENIHVPLGLYNPLLFSGAPSVQRVTNHLDLLPTVADLLDLPHGHAWQGRSLLDDGSSRLVYFYSVSGRQLVGLRDGRYKVIWNRTSRSVEIFDLLEDPLEQNDLSSVLAERIGPYERTLTGWRAYQLALIPRFGLQDESADEGIRWIADLRPSRSYQPHPYDPVADHSVAGRDLQIDWVSYNRGLGTHADSWYTYDIESLDAVRLVGRVGRDRRMIRGEVQAYIVLDGALAFSSGPMEAGTPAVSFDLDVESVHEVSFAAWRSDESGRGDHVNWADLHLITAPEHVYTPGEPAWLDDLRPSGANTPGLAAKAIPTLPRQSISTPHGRVSRGLVVPGGATIHYDVHTLGATVLEGRLFPGGFDGHGVPCEQVELFVDGEPVWQGSPNQITEPSAFEIPLEPSARLVTIRTSEADEDSPMIVLADLEVTTSEEAFLESRRLVAQPPPRIWSLAAVPPLPTAPSPYDVGWSRTLDGSWLEIEGLEEPASLWLRAGSRVSYDLQGLSAGRIQSLVTALGSRECRVTAVVSAGGHGGEVAETLWRSEPLSPGETPTSFEVELGDHELITLSAEGGDDCLLVWATPTLLPDR